MPPDTISIIPARGGSKRIPGKNLLPLGGHPLVAHSILHARKSRYVKEVYVSTEDLEVAEVARRYGADVVLRPHELATDESTSESALLHVLDDRVRRGLRDPELVVFLQCTSPVRRPNDIDQAIETVIAADADSLFSACENTCLIWGVKDGGLLRSVNYDYRSRQREQDMAKQYRENGSIYVFRPEILRRHNNRLGGKIAVYEMDYWSSFQLDSPEHIDLLEWILRRQPDSAAWSWPDKVELVVFDFDGVMTDNTVVVSDTGAEAVRCNRGDGLGIGCLRAAGVPMMVISMEPNPVVFARCAKLKLPCHQGIANKAHYLSNFLKEKGIRPENVIYIGNDVNDIECFCIVGLPVAVADAEPPVLAAAKLVLTRRGGHGAIREFCDRLLAHLADQGSAGA